MLFSGAWGKMIHEKVWNKKSRDTVPLILVWREGVRLWPGYVRVWRDSADGNGVAKLWDVVRLSYDVTWLNCQVWRSELWVVA